jgi:hypothetical protein
VAKGTFDREYWGADFLLVGYATRREFYADYLASTVGDVSAYSAQTTDEQDGPERDDCHG